MKLNKIFNVDYYEYLQDEMRGAKDAESAPNDSAGGTSAGDFIVSAFEVGKITAEQAEKELKFQINEIYFISREKGKSSNFKIIKRIQLEKE